jgi:large subunit ribosomal protein L33
MAKAGARDKITLACTDCKQRNYNSMKNRRTTRTDSK